MHKIRLKYTPDSIWQEFYQGDWDTAVLIGGRGSGKSYNTANYIRIRHLTDFSTRTITLRDVASTIDQSIMQLIKNLFVDAIEKSRGVLSSIFDIQDKGVAVTINNTKQQAIISKGFRTSRLEQKTDLKGFEDIDIAVIEEAEDIRDEERVNILRDTLRKKGHKVIIILNTPDLEHWVIKKYFDYVPTEKPGFFKLIPKKLDRVCQVFVTYRDNQHLDEQTIRRYESYNDPTSENYNPDYYFQSILGYATEKANMRRKFDLNLVKSLTIKQPLEKVDEVKIYQKPISGMRYSIGVDPSSGLGSDYSCITVREFPSGKLAAQMKAKWDERRTANIAVNLAKMYNNAYIACEVNGLGRAVQNYIQDMYIEDRIYKRYIQDTTKQQDTLIPDFGWMTTSKNRDIIINNFADALRLRNIEVLNEDEIEELEHFIWNDMKRRYEAAQNHNDDLIFSDFICYANFDYIRQYA